MADWTPGELEKILWLDAMDESTIVANGNDLVEWADKSGNDNHVNQTIGSADYTSFGVNNKKSVTLGASGYGAISFINPLSIPPGYSMFFVMQALGFYDENSGVWRSGSDQQGDDFFLYRSASGLPWIRRSGVDILMPSTGEPLYINESAIVNINADDQVASYWDLGVEHHSVNHTTTSPGFSLHKIGYQFSSSDYVGAHYGEIIILPGIPTDAEREKIEGYLAHKWGIQAQLPEAHPYFSSPPALGAGNRSSKVSGTVKVDGSPARRIVKAFGYDNIDHTINGEAVTLSKSLGSTSSDPDTGDYSIDLLGAYEDQVFIIAFDDYGVAFPPDTAVEVGDRVHPTTPNGHIFECTGAGTLPSEEPTWIVDTETSNLYGTASMIALPFFRPMVHGPVAPDVTLNLVPAKGRYFRIYINKAQDPTKEPMLTELWLEFEGQQILTKTEAALTSGYLSSSYYYGPDNIIDGSVDTVDSGSQSAYTERYIANTLTDAWVQIDLGSVKEFDKVHILGAGIPGSGSDRCPMDWRLEVSEDGSTWESIYSAQEEPFWEVLEIRSYDALLAPKTDSFFSSVSLLLDMNGIENDTVFVDKSLSERAVSVTGEARIGAAGKFGQALLLDGSGDSLLVGGPEILGPADFTVEAWIFMTATGENEIVAINTSAQYDLIFEVQTDSRLRAQIRNASAGSEVNIELNSAAGLITLSQWHHVALTAEGEVGSIWLDGQLVDSGAITGTRGNNLIGAQIGQLRSGRWFSGLIDEVRITKGVARYSDNFPLPEAPFPDQGPA